MYCMYCMYSIYLHIRRYHKPQRQPLIPDNTLALSYDIVLVLDSIMNYILINNNNNNHNNDDNNKRWLSDQQRQTNSESACVLYSITHLWLPAVSLIMRRA